MLAFQLGCDGGAKLAPALLELGQAIAFQVLADVIEIDARCRRFVETGKLPGVSDPQAAGGTP